MPSKLPYDILQGSSPVPSAPFGYLRRGMNDQAGRTVLRDGLRGDVLRRSRRSRAFRQAHDNLCRGAQDALNPCTPSKSPLDGLE